MEAVMRLACGFLLLLICAASAAAQSRITIDKMHRKDINAAVKEVSYSTLLEGTVDDPDLAVYVMVYESRIKAWRSYRATVINQVLDSAGGYRWRAICNFGEFDGRGVGVSYQVRVIAMDPKLLGKFDWSDPFQAGVLKTNTLAIKRVGK
jgi:hypothetical protein